MPRGESLEARLREIVKWNQMLPVARILMFICIVCFTTRSRAEVEFCTYDLTYLNKADITNDEGRRRAWDELHLVSALQGLANATSPSLYVLWVGKNGSVDRYWLRKMQEQDEWLSTAAPVKIASLDELLTRFRDAYGGLVVWDERVAATSNLASMIAGVERLLPVRFDETTNSLYTQLTQKYKLPVKQRLLKADGSSLFTGTGDIPDIRKPSSGSAKCDAYLWAAEKYLTAGKTNPRRMGYYPDAYWLRSKSGVSLADTQLSNHDYFIAQKAFFFDLAGWDDEAPDDDLNQPLGTDFKTLQTVMHAAYKNSGGDQMIHIGGFTPWDQKYTTHTGRKHDGVPTEWHMLQVLSCFNAYIDADAPGYHAMANASFHQHYPLREKYPQANLPTEKTLREKGYLSDDGEITSRTYVGIYVGDYDSSAWLYRSMESLWDHEDRGKMPLAWAFNPNLADRFPFGIAYARKTATANDSFVAGDNGAGYINPGYLTPPRKYSGLPSGAEAWEKHCTKYFDQWDLNVTGFVIDGYAPEMTTETLSRYARFSPGGIVNWRYKGQTGIHEGMPYLPMSYDLNGGTTECAKLIAEKAPQATGFAAFRTILWSPGQHRQLFEETKKLRPDIEFVDLNTLMLLSKLWQTRQ